MDAKMWAERYYTQLKGAKITSVAVSLFEGREPLPTLVIELPDGKSYCCTIYCDTEGNGPGFLFGLPQVK